MVDTSTVELRTGTAKLCRVRLPNQPAIEPFLDTEPLLDFAYNGPISIMAGPGVQANAHLRLLPAGFEGVVIEPDRVGRSQSISESFTKYATVTAHDDSWTTNRALLIHGWSGTSIAPEYRFRSDELLVGRSTAMVDATRELYFGLEFPGPFFYTPSTRRLVTNALITRIFSRPALIYHAGEAFGEPVLAVLYEGAPLERDESWALDWLVTYLSGRRHGIRSVECLSRDTGLLSATIRASRQPTRRAIRPLYLSQFPGLAANDRVAAVFPDLLTQVLAIAQGPDDAQRRMTATLHAYQDATDTDYPASRYRNLAVALDALMALVAGRRKTTVDGRLYRPFSKLFKKTIKNAPWIPSAARSAWISLLHKINEEPVKERQRRFFVRLGIDLDRLSEPALKNRNPAVHEGFFGPDDGQIEGLLEIAGTTDRLVEIFNRAMLSFIGYDGPYRTEVLDEGAYVEGMVRDFPAAEDIDRATSRAFGLTQAMRPDITLELAKLSLPVNEAQVE